MACSRTVVIADSALKPELISERRLVSEAWDDFKWSPDGSQLLLSRWVYQETGIDPPQRMDAPVGIADAESGQVQVIPQSGYSPLWSPEGAAVLFRSAGNADSDGQYWVYSVNSGRLTPLEAIPDANPWLWLESGLYYQDESGLERVQIVGVQKDGSESYQPMLSQPEVALAFDGSLNDRWASPSPDGATFILIDHTNLAHRRWWLVQPDGRQVEMVYPLYSLGSCCAWSRNSERLAYFGLAPGQGLYIVDSSGRNLKRLVSASQLGEGAFTALDFSPDGRWIAFTWTEAGEGFPFDRSQIYVVREDGQGLQQLTSDSLHPHNWLSWSPDGRYIAFKGIHRDIWLAEVELP